MTGDGHPTSPSKLNLGCGDDYLKGWVNVDVDAGFEPDVVLDLEETPWPWEDDEFEEILVDNVLEHIDPSRRSSFLAECRRVLRQGGILIVRLPTRTGWDVTHYAVPSYTWPNHPNHREDWEVETVDIERVGPGYLMPDSVALFCTRYDIVRCIQEVEVRVR